MKGSHGPSCAEVIRARRPCAPRVGLVLGSGLGAFADAVEKAVRFSYAELPGFPLSGVSGHAGEMVLGTVAGVEVAVMAGRAHYYEHGDASVMRTPMETFQALGCTAVILTNAAGGLHPEVPPGELMLITDHINFAGTNPLFGEPTDRRFVGLSQAYDPHLQALFHQAAAEEGIRLATGTYMWFSGPSFEAPAEIRAARILGADAVGMSTVPEVILARFFGLRVAAVSTITNYAAGMTDVELSHEDVKEVGPMGAAKLMRLLPRVIAAYGSA
ncbi:purine-nucleoside phosphorylase [Chthonobacter rhizosphaerae]|uniref:purine-nucleoside phosphorylase n=1 Tax=Chthonobacter rhizosphaerae TaxID=2735553 RepID=UPI0015EE5B06|nr:purine-nucleoside phosphorylase [Chthonobacter rhizosphaerae]